MAKKDLTKMSSFELVEALIMNNSLASEFDKRGLWKKIYPSDWSNLLKSHPQFSNKCPDKIYDEFTQAQWKELEAKHPETFEDIRKLSTLRKLASNKHSQ